MLNATGHLIGVEVTQKEILPYVAFELARNVKRLTRWWRRKDCSSARGCSMRHSFCRVDSQDGHLGISGLAVVGTTVALLPSPDICDAKSSSVKSAV